MTFSVWRHAFSDSRAVVDDVLRNVGHARHVAIPVRVTSMLPTGTPCTVNGELHSHVRPRQEVDAGPGNDAVDQRPDVSGSRIVLRILLGGGVGKFENSRKHGHYATPTGAIRPEPLNSGQQISRYSKLAGEYTINPRSDVTWETNWLQ